MHTNTHIYICASAAQNGKKILVWLNGANLKDSEHPPEFVLGTASPDVYSRWIEK